MLSQCAPFFKIIYDRKNFACSFKIKIKNIINNLSHHLAFYWFQNQVVIPENQHSQQNTENTLKIHVLK